MESAACDATAGTAKLIEEFGHMKAGKMTIALWAATRQWNFRAKCRVRRQIFWRTDALDKEICPNHSALLEEVHR
ncbi:MAG TPA: hypothetical protein PK225_12550 [Azonexus sp.]|nr:hypothetical protein [Azonexus sp.]